MTPQQKRTLVKTIGFYKERPEWEQHFLVGKLEEQIKNMPNHKNSLPAKIFLRIHKKL